MKMIKHLTRALLLISLVGVQSNCLRKEPCKDYDPPIPSTYYCWKTLKTDYINNQGIKPLITKAKELPANALGIRLYLGVDENYININKNYKYGCTTYVGAAITSSDTFSISTVYDFDQTHKAGSDISEYFTVWYNTHASYDLYQNIPDWRSEISITRNKVTQADIYLMKAPVLNDSVQFIIMITQRFTPNRELKTITAKARVL